jgi:hypothetical protein
VTTLSGSAGKKRGAPKRAMRCCVPIGRQSVSTASSYSSPPPRVVVGGGGKNPLRTVLMIAVMVVATVYGGPLGASLGFPGNLATAVGSSIIMTADSALVSAMVPLPTPNMPSFATGGGSMAQPLPTYSLQGQGNYARLAQPAAIQMDATPDGGLDTK